jgi:hypothetical protein
MLTDAQHWRQEMLRVLAPLTALMLVVSTQCHADDISGTYKVVGKDTLNKPYAGTATITMTGDAKCAIVMSTLAGVVAGHCMVTERSVAAFARLTDDLHTMAIYVRGAEGVLSGIWVESAYKGTGSETLTPVR